MSRYMDDRTYNALRDLEKVNSNAFILYNYLTLIKIML